MNPLASFAPLAQAFGLTVAHSLWQITLIWAVFKLLEWKLNRQHQAVYLLSISAMVAATLWSVFTFTTEWARLKPLDDSFLPDGNLDPVVSSFVSAENGSGTLSLWDSTQFWLESHSAQIGWAWLICAGLLWLRLIGGWYLAQRLRIRDVLMVADSFQYLCRDWVEKLKINPKIQLLESPHIAEPLTLGFWKPVVLFPVGMLLQLSPTQVEALLLHELAHIRRHDYLVNLFQLGLEVCFFYHPLFWLLSREARSRREFCCDELVLKHTADPILYAQTLTDLQLSFLQPSNQFVMNATGKSRFTERILHIMGMSPKRSARPNFLLALLLPLAFALSSWWPAPPESTVNDTMDGAGTSVLDSIPPKRAALDPTIARPREEAKPAQSKTLDKVADDLGQKYENQRIGIQVEPTVPENIAMEVVKMNVFYIGVDNPLRIAAAGVPPAELRVELIGDGSITGSEGNYVVHVKTPGEVKVRVMRQVGLEIKFVVDQIYRVKRIPDPTPKLDGKYRSSSITPEMMQQSKGIEMVLDNFDFDAYCEVVSFEVTYLPKEPDPITKYITGGKWNDSMIEWVKNAKPGDAFFFDDIKVKCPGDSAPRNIGGMAFKIKE